MKQYVYIFSLLLLNTMAIFASDPSVSNGRRPSSIQTPTGKNSGLSLSREKRYTLQPFKNNPRFRKLALQMAILTGTQANIEFFKYTDDELLEIGQGNRLNLIAPLPIDFAPQKDDQDYP